MPLDCGKMSINYLNYSSINGTMKKLINSYNIYKEGWMKNTNFSFLMWGSALSFQ